MDTRDNLTRHQVDLGKRRIIIVLSDSRTAIDAVINVRSRGPLSYLNKVREDVELHELRYGTEIFVGWIKGHSGIAGNEAADLLAKRATETKDSIPGTSHCYLKEESSKNRQSRWESWYKLKKHFHDSIPTRRIHKRHRGQSRLDTATLFRLRTNKGWVTGDKIGTQAAPNCNTCQPSVPHDSEHIMQCPEYEDMRPEDITETYTSTKKTPATLDWIRHHNHFGVTLSTYEVRYIKLRIGNLWKNDNFPCHLCERICPRAEGLRLHLLTHEKGPLRNQIKAPTCNICQKKLWKGQVDAHYLSHEVGNIDAKGQTVQRGPCSECGIPLNRLTRRDHMQNHHIAVQCHGCSSFYSGREKLVEHQRSNCGGSRS